ncbi:MAG TPA: 3,4-dihydroxy-2-butanone-4-phosphate synthase [Segeticoccus sp.]|uniref:3,4-dihydroxy-2-butanone-4-phosphate synthase n=1 Tax=Segeticoccus sp. TaxID=2706531 RepID=UPI002D808F7F|nr:3,4-dihydroxy-2-butanone-4-phosphate synthase [Segeticoccus sp.]HET8600645.1 3,4-dihydroxy-2-butanone-4-phosphate synthase [Segeticoccus sp.]
MSTTTTETTPDTAPRGRTTPASSQAGRAAGTSSQGVDEEHAVAAALTALRAGRPVLVTDAEDRENEGDVILAAQTLRVEWLAWTVRHTSGVLCAPMTAAVADRLELPPMVTHNQDPRGTAYTISVDAREGVTTGISAADRTHTLQLLADPATTAGDLVRPGHVFPLRARPGGVLERPGHTEAAADLCRLAGLAPVGVIAELVHDAGEVMRGPAVRALAAAHELPVLTIADLVQWRRRHERVVRSATTVLPTRYGEFTLHGYRDLLTGAEHAALVAVGRSPDHRAPAVRVHSECLTGDVFGSRRCDCGEQLDRSLARVAEHGGIVVYLRGHEGRGVGLTDKLRAYALQDSGLDTVDAQTELGLPVDAREYGAAAGILHDLGVSELRLLTNNPRKVDALRDAGIAVDTVEPLPVPVHSDNARYLATKRDRLGHRLLLDATIAGGDRRAAL